MGETRVGVEIGGTKLTEELREVLVDTGSTNTALPPALAEKHGIEILSETEVDTAAGISVTRLRSALIRIEKKLARVPVLILKELSEPVIGLTTLEALGYKVNPITGKLEPARPKALSQSLP